MQISHTMLINFTTEVRLHDAQVGEAIDNIGSRMDWNRDHVHALNRAGGSMLRRELQLPMLYWPILWKFGSKELIDLLCM